MHSSYDSLKAGLFELVAEVNTPQARIDLEAFWRLLSITSSLIEGNKEEKIRARERLKKIIGRGRCILNAAELAKKDPASFAAELTRQQGEGAP